MRDGKASIAADLKRMRKKFSRLASRVQKKMNPDDLHDLRVLTRRMRAVIWVSRHTSTGPRLKKLRGAIRELGYALGERRTLDVLERDAAHYGLSKQVPNKARDKSSKKAASEICRLLTPRGLQASERLLLDAEKSLERLRKRDIRLAVAELIVRLEALQDLQPKKESDWHRLRIEIKKIRYVSELLGLRVSEMKQLQDLLGKGHDLSVLMAKTKRRPKIESDMKRCWTQAKKLTPATLRNSHERLLKWRAASVDRNA